MCKTNTSNRVTSPIHSYQCIVCIMRSAENMAKSFCEMRYCYATWKMNTSNRATNPMHYNQWIVSIMRSAENTATCFKCYSFVSTMSRCNPDTISIHLFNTCFILSSDGVVVVVPLITSHKIISKASNVDLSPIVSPPEDFHSNTVSIF